MSEPRWDWISADCSECQLWDGEDAGCCIRGDGPCGEFMPTDPGTAKWLAKELGNE